MLGDIGGFHEASSQEGASGDRRALVRRPEGAGEDPDAAAEAGVK